MSNFNVKEFLANTELYLLENGGVDNWDWYNESLSEANINSESSAAEIINALNNGGVDNWTWYGESLGRFSEYADYVHHLSSSVSFNEDALLSYEDWVSLQDEIEAEKAAQIEAEKLAEAKLVKPRKLEKLPA